MAVAVFASRVREPTCKNLDGAPGDKRTMAAHEGTCAPPTGPRRAKVELRNCLIKGQRDRIAAEQPVYVQKARRGAMRRRLAALPSLYQTVSSTTVVVSERVSRAISTNAAPRPIATLKEASTNVELPLTTTVVLGNGPCHRAAAHFQRITVDMGIFTLPRLSNHRPSTRWFLSPACKSFGLPWH